MPLLTLATHYGLAALGLSAANQSLTRTKILARKGYPLNTRCGSRGLCGGCEFGLRAGHLRRTTDGNLVAPGPDGRLRACQLQLTGDEPVVVLVPARSLLKHEPAIVAEFKV